MTSNYTMYNSLFSSVMCECAFKNDCKITCLVFQFHVATCVLRTEKEAQLNYETCLIFSISLMWLLHDVFESLMFLKSCAISFI